MATSFSSTSQVQNTPSESSSPINSSTFENSFTSCSSDEDDEEEEEDEEERDSDSENNERDQSYSGNMPYEISASSKIDSSFKTPEMFISSLNCEIKVLQESIQEFKEILNKKDKDIKEKSNAIADLEKQCKMKSEKLEQICKTRNDRIQELETTLNEKDKDIKKKSNAIEDLEKQCKMIQNLEEKLCKKEREITAKNQAVATLESQCKKNKKEVIEITTQYNVEILQNKKVQGEQASEIKRLQKYEEIHPAIQAKLVDLEKELGNYEETLAKANGKIKQLTNELRTAGKEKDELLHRLSKIAGAKLTYNNPNIADLSDQKRPTKLAEEFAELYDNEWTDAFEDVDIKSDEDKVAYMLSLLKRAYGLCKIASQNHMKKMRSSICKLTLGAKQTSGERNKHPKTKCGEVVFDYEKFQDEQKKAVMDLGKFVEIKLSTEFEKIVVDDIASEYCIDKNNRKKLYVYTQKCVNICWSMCRLEMPVAIGLQDVYDGMHLDTSVFKAYTKSGKFVDYIVWPPLYLHENGPLLCKGVAQGKA